MVFFSVAGCREVVLERLPYVQDCGVLAPFDLVDVRYPVSFTILFGGVEPRFQASFKKGDEKF